ncbi:transposase [Ruegeria aquimaris]|uniref:transposase n=1 Tax=Ruegeria aquimaris TaxID=2984333 RepID=UPI00384D80CD
MARLRGRRTLSGPRAAWALENHHARRRATPVRHHRAKCDRRGHASRDIRHANALPVTDDGLFTLYAGHLLAPTLSPGDIDIPDNLPAHKVTRARTAIEAAGESLLFLPPYSPDFNPIEQAFAKIKALLRKAAARSVEALETAIATVLEAFTPDECANYFASSGYEPNRSENALTQQCPLGVTLWCGTNLTSLPDRKRPSRACCR